ncbi:MAG: hypothetical protein K8F91_01765, partial [Candidatus Obscuribacterales bacterium]|nr:hypothetical protein [Candidatus Obscuribacterales bacterium]
MIKESLIRSSELRLLLASILCLTVNLPAISNSPDSQTTMNRRTNLLIARHKKAESSDTTGSEEVDEVGKLIEQADLASDSDDREKAIVIYEKALSLTDSNNSTNCNLSTLLRKLGLAYSLSKRFGIAIKTLERAIAESEKEQSQEAVTDLVASHYALARTYEADISLDNAHQKALSECQSALDLATSQLADNRRLIARVKALKAELVFS